MLAQKYRLSKQRDFQRLFLKGKKDSNRFFNLRYLKNNFGYCRLAVVASLKLSKKSPERNLYRRRIRAILHDDLDNFKEGYDIIINILSPCLGKEYQFLRQELLKLLKKNKLF